MISYDFPIISYGFQRHPLTKRRSTNEVSQFILTRHQNLGTGPAPPKDKAKQRQGTQVYRAQVMEMLGFGFSHKQIMENSWL